MRRIKKRNKINKKKEKREKESKIKLPFNEFAFIHPRDPDVAIAILAETVEERIKSKKKEKNKKRKE